MLYAFFRFMEIGMPSEQYAIKAIKKNRFGGYTAVWGNAEQLDLQGDYFTRETDFALEAYPYRPLIHHHGQNSQMDRTIIGTIDMWKKDHIGLWCEGEFKRLDDDLDIFDEEERKLRQEYIDIIKEKITAGELNFSSGALGHLVKRNDDGWLKQWWWGESSTTGSPAEPRRTEIEMMKAIKGLDTFLAQGETPRRTDQPKTDELQDATKTEVQPLKVSDEVGEPDKPDDDSHDKGDTLMTPEEFLAMFGQFSPEDQAELLARLAQMTEAFSEEMDKASKPEDEEEEENKQEEEEEEEENKQDEEEEEEIVIASLSLEKQLMKHMKNDSFIKSVATMVKQHQSNDDDLRSKIKGMMNAKPPRGSGGKFVPGVKANRAPRITQKSKYERLNWTAEDYAFFIYGKQAYDRNWQPDNGLIREATAKLTESADEYELSAKAFGQLQRASSFAKADEVENTGQTGYGAEWVAEGWANNIIQKARVDNVVLPLMNSVEMPTNPYNMPIEGTDPTVFSVAETEDQSQLTHTSGNAATMSKVGTGKIQLTAGQLVVWIAISEFEEEDALVPVLGQKRKQSQRAIADAMDAVILSADPAATGNINLNGGTLGATSKFRYGGDSSVGGLAYVPLKTTATNLANMGGAPTWAQLRDLRRLLAKGYSIKQADLAYIVDVDSWHALSLMEGVVLVSDYGNEATIMTGEVGRIGLVPVFASEQFPLADDDGFVNNTAALNKKGRALIVHRPTQYVGYRRRPKVDNYFDPIQGAHEIRVSVRMSTNRFDADSVAMLKNITV